MWFFLIIFEELSAKTFHITTPLDFSLTTSPTSENNYLPIISGKIFMASGHSLNFLH
jgi:hypothetical protein